MSGEGKEAGGARQGRTVSCRKEPALLLGTDGAEADLALIAAPSVDSLPPMSSPAMLVALLLPAASPRVNGFNAACSKGLTPNVGCGGACSSGVSAGVDVPAGRLLAPATNPTRFAEEEAPLLVGPSWLLSDPGSEEPGRWLSLS